MLFTFTIAQILFNMKDVAFIDNIQGQFKVFCYIMIHENNHFKCILMMLHHFKHREIDMHLLSALKNACLQYKM